MELLVTKCGEISNEGCSQVRMECVFAKVEDSQSNLSEDLLLEGFEWLGNRGLDDTSYF